MLTLVLAGQMALIGAVQAKPVLYTLTTVSDGQLGSLKFTEAAVTITFTGDTRNVRSSSETGTIVFTNREGAATVSISQNGQTVKATFNPGQIYVRYDVYNGAVGFGSAISATYPIVVGCGFESCGADASNGTPWGYVIGDYGTIGDPSVLPTPSDLSHSTVFTGSTSACAVDYGVGACPTAATAGLKTDHGSFYLQDIYWNLGYSDYADYDSNCNYEERSVCGGNVGFFSVDIGSEAEAE
jgi:hypothetical protein